MAKRGNLLGAWAFLAGVIIALIVGVLNTLTIGGVSTISGTWAIILVAIGIIIGLLNVGGREMTTFLLAAVSLVIVSAFGAASMASLPIVVRILEALLVLFVPATIVVALKALFVVAKN